MKYVIVFDERYENFLEPLVKEIERFDVRAEIKQVVSNQIDKNSIKSFSPESIIYLGSATKYQKLNRLKCLHFCIELISDKRVHSASKLHNFHKVFATSPAQFNFIKLKQVAVEYLGNPLVDILRTIHTSENPSITPVIAIHLGNDPNKTVIRRIKSLIQKKDNYSFIIISDGGALRNLDNSNCRRISPAEEYPMLKTSNVAITHSSTSILESLLLNVPQVVTHGPSNFLSFASRISAQKMIIEEEIAKSLSKEEEIADEIDQILNDFEYCASMLDKYQIVREKIGMEPFFRRVAQQIVEEVEAKQL